MFDIEFDGSNKQVVGLGEIEIVVKNDETFWAGERPGRITS